ncbi:MAG: hypothetical protein R3B90_04140 [Planctomycetaceae bacterium]
MKLSRHWMLSLMLLSTGCGGGVASMDYGAVTLVPATGTVTLDGQPLAGGYIMFESENGMFSDASIDDGGRYVLQFDSEVAGVTPGSKTVRITSVKPPMEGEEDGVSENADGSRKVTERAAERVPANYNKASELTITVTTDKTTYDFELKSAGE